MKKYSLEIQAAALRRILPPNSETLAQVSRDMGISIPTLIAWKKSAASSDNIDIENTDDECQLSSEEKFDIVVLTAHMNETEFGEFARNKGIFVEQIEQWRLICRQANANFGQVCKRYNALLKEKDEEIKEIQRDLAKKNKALAEMAAELVLRKKCMAIWGEEEAE